MRRVLYICLVLLLAVACGPRVIKRAKMQKIMADVLVQSQQVKQDIALSRQADTMLVYEGIFEAYGYNTDDFLRSISYYLSDASRMEKIMSAVADDLEARAKEVKAVIDLQEWRNGFLRIYTLQPDTTLPHPRVRAADTMRIRFAGDSVYFHIVDTVKLREELYQRDTLQ